MEDSLLEEHLQEAQVLGEMKRLQEEAEDLRQELERVSSEA